MPNEVGELLDALRRRVFCRMVSDPAENLHGLELWAQPKEIIKLPQIRQLALHLFVLSLHGLRRLLVRSEFVYTCRLFLAAASTDGAFAVALALTLPARDAGA